MCFEKFGKKMHKMHRNPVNCFLHIIAAIVIICALWWNSLSWIMIGVLIGVIGHIIQAAGEKKPAGKKQEKKLKKSQKKKKK